MKPRTRFFLFLLPRVVTGTCSVWRLGGYAIALTESGDKRLARWCLDRAIRESVSDVRTYRALLEFFIRAGHPHLAADVANGYYDWHGMKPAEALRLIVQFVQSEGYEAALRIFQRMLERCDGDITLLSPAPAPPEPLDAVKLRALLEARLTGKPHDEAEATKLRLTLARLCFSCAVLDVSAQLFEQAGEHAALHPRDRLAHVYALFRRGGADAIPSDIETLCSPRVLDSMDADWQIVLATLLFAQGAVDAAATAAEAALRAKLGSRADIEAVVADCRAMVAGLAACPETLAFGWDGEGTGLPDATGLPEGTGLPGTSELPEETALPEASEPPQGGTTLPEASELQQGNGVPATRVGIRKLFVCGYGWSGSGALYDALTEFDGLAEAPDNPVDRHINPCTGNEMTFLQGPAGLGRLWQRAKQDRGLTRLALWETLEFHVLGGGAIGYSEHKSARTASSLLQDLGARYSAIFRRAFENIAALPERPRIGELQANLAEATESLTALLTGASDGQCVVFNNAVFGYSIDMLEIFRNFRAAVVARDPLDQYADRRVQDSKFWMSPQRFAAFYRRTREDFQAKRQRMQPALARQVREAEFERLVLEETYRQDIIDWLLEGQSLQRVRRTFQPECSAKNIGIHSVLLTAAERKAMKRALKGWRPS